MWCVYVDVMCSDGDVMCLCWCHVFRCWCDVIRFFCDFIEVMWPTGYGLDYPGGGYVGSWSDHVGDRGQERFRWHGGVIVGGQQHLRRVCRVSNDRITDECIGWANIVPLTIDGEITLFSVPLTIVPLSLTIVPNIVPLTIVGEMTLKSVTLFCTFNECRVSYYCHFDECQSAITAT